MFCKVKRTVDGTLAPPEIYGSVSNSIITMKFKQQKVEVLLYSYTMKHAITNKMHLPEKNSSNPALASNTSKTA